MVNFNLTNISFHGIITISMKGDIFMTNFCIENKELDMMFLNDMEKMRRVANFCNTHNISSNNIQDYFEFVDSVRELARKGWLKLNE